MPIYNKQKDLIEVKRSASTGLGLFATQAIGQGRFILEYTGELISAKEAQARGGKYLFQINSRLILDGKGRENVGRYINHSCRPNCEVQIQRKQIFIYAMKDICPGEELGYDYGQEYFYSYIKPNGCKCSYCRLKRLIQS